MSKSLIGTFDWVAIYAAVLSTIVFLWNIKNSKPSYSVELAPSAQDNGKEIEDGIDITIKNPSSKVVNISNISLVYASPREAFFLVNLYRGLSEKLLNLEPSNVRAHYFLPVHGELFKPKTFLSIDAHNSKNIFVPLSSMEEMLKDPDVENGVFYAIVQDALSRRRYSPIFRYTSGLGKAFNKFLK